MNVRDESVEEEHCHYTNLRIDKWHRALKRHCNTPGD